MTQDIRPPPETRSRTSQLAVAEAPHVLLVDDQPARLLSYEAILSGLDLRCVRALSGIEAPERLLKQEFAVIVLDVNMPGMDGFEVARMIRQHPRLERTPIIFVTGVNITELDQLKGYEVGGIDYISIPVVPEILRSKIAILVELHQRRAESPNIASSIARTTSSAGSRLWATSRSKPAAPSVSSAPSAISPSARISSPP